MDCNNCPTKGADPVACRMCRQEQEEQEKKETLTLNDLYMRDLRLKKRAQSKK
jgi:hypothetical protein